MGLVMKVRNFYPMLGGVRAGLAYPAPPVGAYQVVTIVLIITDVLDIALPPVLLVKQTNSV